MKPRARRTARVVPGLVLSASFLGVVPACALVACGGTETRDGGADAQVDGVAADAFLGVAAVAYCCFDAMGVADVGFVVDAADGDAPDGD